MKNRSIILILIVSALFSCAKKEINPDLQAQYQGAIVGGIAEGFENATKTAYTAADVTLGTGVWNLNDAMIGNTTSDRKTGLQSARVRNSGKLTMRFDKPNGAATVSVQHAKYGTDANGTWQLWYSVNGGSTYVQLGSTITTSSTTLQTTSFTLNVSGNIRIEIRKTDGGTQRINFDEISIYDYSSSSPAPVLTSISPSSAAAGSATLNITVNGSSFVSTSKVLWNGAALSTTFVSATQLTASVTNTLLATAGSASVSVNTPAPGGGTSTSVTFTITAASSAKKFLFDATKAQTAGNADWVIDQDNNVPQRIPTPLQSGITSSTAETYWTGANSAWAIALVKLGHQVETLPATGSITYGNTSNTQDLSNYNVFVINEPNKVFTASEKTALLQFVQNGGGLCMIANHNGSDRNNDGWDAPGVWNDFFTNNGIASNPFGITVALNNISETTSNITTTASPIINGIQGSVTQLQFSNGTTFTTSTTANPSVRGLIWRSGYTQNTSNVMCATSTYGNGRVFMLGDSSPVDDGTGATTDILYNGWGVFSHSKLLMNASLWLAKLQ